MTTADEMDAELGSHGDMFLQQPILYNSSLKANYGIGNGTDGNPPAMDNSLQQLLNFQYYSWVVAGNIVSAFGLLGNILSVIVLSNKRMKSSTSCYLIALAVFDSLVLVSLILCMALPTIFFATGKLERYYQFYPYLHPFAYPIALISQTCSIYITVGFTVERYIAVCRPLRASKMCTMSRARKSLLAIFLCSVIYNIPRMLEYTIVHEVDPITNVTYAKNIKTTLGSNKTFRHIYFICMHMIVMLVVPFTLLAVLNALLIRAVKHSERAHGKVSHKTRRENNLTVMLISVVIVFLICQVPSIIDNIFMATLSQETLDTPPFVKLTCICSLMVITNSATNFYLYCVFGQKFRRIFCKIFCVLKGRMGTTTEQDTLLYQSTFQNHERGISCKSSRKSNKSVNKRQERKDGLSMVKSPDKCETLLLVNSVNGNAERNVNVKYLNSHASMNNTETNL